MHLSKDLTTNAQFSPRANQKINHINPEISFLKLQILVQFSSFANFVPSFRSKIRCNSVNFFPKFAVIRYRPTPSLLLFYVEDDDDDDGSSR